MPRLPRFVEQNPDIDVQVIADSRLLDLRAEGIDLAIRFGHGRYPGYAVTLLMRDVVVPVCSPRLIGRHANVETVDDLLRLPLLADSTTSADGSGTDWQSWLDAMGRSDAVFRTGARFSDAGLMIEAALLGLGVGLARVSLVGDHLAAGALVCPLSFAAPSAYAYYLLALPEDAASPKITRFRDWVLAEAAAMPATSKVLAGADQASARIPARA
jgi:LysR family glycine cleavage system transcriptional activator